MDKSRDQNRPTKTETVRTMAGKPIATIRTNPTSGVKSVYDNLGNYMGKFDPRKNTTFNSKGSPVSKGNGLLGVATNTICPKGFGAVCHPVAVIQSAYRPRVAHPSFQAIPGSAYPRSPWRRW